MLLKKILFVCFSVGICFSLSAGDLKIKNGESIAFLGDSITQGGWNIGGYIHFVISGLQHMGVQSKPIPAGISGHKSTQMNARVQKDVIEKNPAWMTLSCGVNDVWHGPKGVPLEQYKKEITELLDKVDKAGIKVMILTATMIFEDPNNGLNQNLAPYNDWLRKIAKERNYLLADLNADMQKIILQKKTENPQFKGNVLTSDGVHMAAAGNKMMAKGILRAFGATEKQLEEIEKITWRKLPCKTYTIRFSEEDMELLNAAAKLKNLSVDKFIYKSTIDKAMENISIEK